MSLTSIGSAGEPAELIRRALGDADPCEVLYFDMLDSTNTEAKRRAPLAGKRPLLIVAGGQSAGRGRLGRDFYSPESRGLYFSILYPLSVPFEQGIAVTSASAVAVMRAIRKQVGVQTEIKWVNDLYYKGKKVCGILTEAISMPQEDGRYLIVGIGINLRTGAFPPELDGIAGSLGADEADAAAVIAAVVSELLPFLRDPADHSWLEDYRGYSCVIGRKVVWEQGNVRQTGIAKGIGEDGALEVCDDDGRMHSLRTGEISLRTV